MKKDITVDLAVWLHRMWYCRGKSVEERKNCEWIKRKFDWKYFLRGDCPFDCKFFVSGLCKNPKFNKRKLF